MHLRVRRVIFGSVTYGIPEHHEMKKFRIVVELRGFHFGTICCWYQRSHKNHKNAGMEVGAPQFRYDASSLAWQISVHRIQHHERLRRLEAQTEAFREAMLLFKLNSDYLLPLNGVVPAATAHHFTAGNELPNG